MKEPPRRTGGWALVGVLPPWLLAAAAALAGALATFHLSALEESLEQARAQAHFAALASEYAGKVLDRLRDSTSAMAALSSLHRARRGLDRGAFDTFVPALLGQLRPPGLVAVLWLPRVPEADRADFVARMRREVDPTYGIHPAPGTGEVQPVAYIAGAEEARARALGFDALSDPVRRAAMDRAITEGRVAMTAPLVAATDPPGHGRGAVVMYLPVFAGTAPADAVARRQSVLGHVGAVFRMDEVAASVSDGLAGAHLRIVDLETQEPPWFASDSALPERSRLTADEVISFGGRLLKLEFRSTAAVERGLMPGAGRLTMGFGGTLTVVLALFVYYLASTGRRAERAVQRATSRLRASEERFALAAEVSADAVWERDLIAGRPLGSARVDALLGFPPGATADGRVDPQELIHPEDRPAHRAALEAHLRDGKPYAVEFRVRRADGEWRWLRSRGIAQRDAAGRPVRMVGTVTDITEARSEEDRLARYRAFLRNILDRIPDPVIVKSRDQCYVIVNQAYADWVGLPVEQVIGRRAHDFFPSDVADRAIAVDDRVFADGQSRTLEELWPDAQRGVRHIVVQKVAAQGPDGEPLVVGVYHDVTDLRSAAARFEAAIETTPLVAIVGVSRDGAVTLWNRAATELFGRSAADVLGQPAGDFLVVQSGEGGFADLCRGVVEKGEATTTGEFLVSVPGGRTVWVLGAIFPVTRGGTVTELFAMGVDVTDRRKALQDLAVSEARFRSLTELSSDWFWEQDAEYRFTAMSLGVAKGRYTSAATLGKTRWELPIDASEAQWIAHKADLEARRPFRDFQYRIRDLEGRWRWYSVSGEPLFDDGGEFIGYRGVGQDITDRRDAEEEVRRHRDHLAELVQEKTADLLLAKESAEAANQAKSEFLANMTHELRTPMHAILSFARLGRDKVASLPTERMANYLQKIIEGGQRLLALIDDLLDLSRLEAGKMPIELHQTDVAAICRQVMDEMASLSDAKALHLQLRQESPSPSAAIDARRVGQVIGNLLSNAIKFSPVGGHITVTLREEAMPAGRRAGDRGTIPALYLAVADEGVGVPDTELEAVFDKFVQSTRTRSGAGGTGLGLAICREIVLAHRGIIRASNRQSGGALFEVLIPKT